MKLRSYGAIFAVGCAFATSAVAKDTGPSLRDRQQAACYNDAQRLCGEFVPDVAKISACMHEKRAEVSHKCHKMMKATE